MKLSEHFAVMEFVASPQGEKAGIINNPLGIHIENMTRLCANVLEPIRKHFGRPVNIRSGYRCPALNKLVGGAANSQHMLGEAADIEIPGIDNADIWRWIDAELEFDQVIAEYLREDDGSAGWVHVSYNHYGNRDEAISCVAKGKYLPGLHFVRES